MHIGLSLSFFHPWEVIHGTVTLGRDTEKHFTNDICHSIALSFWDKKVGFAELCFAHIHCLESSSVSSHWSFLVSLPQH